MCPVFGMAPVLTTPSRAREACTMLVKAPSLANLAGIRGMHGACDSLLAAPCQAREVHARCW